MSGEEMIRLYVTLGVWGLMLLAAIRFFGFGRVLWVIAVVAFLAAVITFKSLGAITGGRRY